MKDLIGKAILDYQTNNAPEDIITETSLTEADSMSVAYLFRGYEDMPGIEQKALQLVKGKILDVGCGAGSHSLYLQEKGFEVTAIDISENATSILIGTEMPAFYTSSDRLEDEIPLHGDSDTLLAVHQEVVDLITHHFTSR